MKKEEWIGEINEDFFIFAYAVCVSGLSML